MLIIPRYLGTPHETLVAALTALPSLPQKCVLSFIDGSGLAGGNWGAIHKVGEGVRKSPITLTGPEFIALLEGEMDLWDLYVELHFGTDVLRLEYHDCTQWELDGDDSMAGQLAVLLHEPVPTTPLRIRRTADTLVLRMERPPQERWQLSPKMRADARELVAFYVEDAGGLGEHSDLLQRMDRTLTDSERKEIESIAAQCRLTRDEILLANVYYDAFQNLFGCTAIGMPMPSEDAVEHVRNLDWHSPGDLLSRTSIHVYAVHGKRDIGQWVTWPGAIGTLTGFRRKTFSVSLNAVLSDEPRGHGRPVSLLLRETIERCESFGCAVEKLTQAELVGDALFMVCGTKPDERLVIERTPRKAAHRGGERHSIATNSYRALTARGEWSSDLARSSDARFAAVERHLNSGRKPTAVLASEDVMVESTVQRVRMRADQDTLGLEIWELGKWERTNR